MDAVVCPMCGTENPSSALHCRNCRVNLKLALRDSGEIEHTLHNRASGSSPEHSQALSDIPGGLLLQQDAGGLKAAFRWFSWRRLLVYVPGTVSALLCSAFFGLFLEWPRPNSPNWIALGFLVLALWQLYTILGITFNRTEIKVSREALSVRHGPLAIRRKWAIGYDIPWRLQIEEVTKTAILGIPIEGGWAGFNYKLFQLNIWILNEEKRVLLSTFDREVAVFLKSAIQEYTAFQAPLSRHSGKQ